MFSKLFRVIRFHLGVARVDTEKCRATTMKGCEGLTELQKQQIFSMRMQGIGYHVIGKTLDLKENQVQLYCKAHGLAGDPNLVILNHAVWCEQNNRCAFCDRKLQQPPRGRHRRFCSGSCRTRYCIMKNKIWRNGNGSGNTQLDTDGVYGHLSGDMDSQYSES